MRKLLYIAFILSPFVVEAQYNCMDTKQAAQAVSALNINNNAKSDTFDILDYDIYLNLYGIAQQEFKAEARIKVNPKINGAQVLNLDLWKLQVDTVIFPANTGSYSYNDSLLSIDFGSGLNPGDTTSVWVYYSGQPQGDPLNWGGFHSGQGYYYNLGVGFGSNPHTYGRAWFPCYDNFVEKSTYQLRVLSKSPMQPLISGDQINRQTSGDSIMSTARLEAPIPTYLISFALANYQFLSDSVQGLNGPIDILLAAKSADTANLKASFVNLKPTLHAFEHYFGPYQWPRIGYAATTVGAMEHATSISYPINLINGNLNGEDIMAHELAHHWFGNLITCETAEDMWINEGMAEFSSHIYTEQVYGRARYIDIVRDNAWNVLQYAAIRDGNMHRPLYGMPHEHVYGYHTYQKGAMVGHNMRHYLGDTIFFSSIQQLFADHAYGNLNSVEFRDEMIRISGNSNLQDFWQDWVFEPGYPQFSVDDWSYNQLLGRVNVYLRQRTYAAPNYFNNVPVDVTFFKADGTHETRRLNHSGLASQHLGLLINFEPIAVIASYGGSLLTATGYDHIHFDQAGTKASNYGGLTISTSNYVDTGSVIVMQHLVSADPDSNSPFDFRLGKNHYYTVEQLYFNQTTLKAELRFDGSQRGLDQELLQNGNDSLVVLYRAKGADQWNLYPYQTKQAGSTNSRIGSFILDPLWDGDYVLANSKESLAIETVSPEEEQGITLYPNPVQDSLTLISKDGPIDWRIEIITPAGRTRLDQKFSQQSEVKLSMERFPAGNYLIRVNGIDYQVVKI